MTHRDQPVAGLVLAAGAGSRFGGPKALARLDGEVLVDRVSGLLRDADLTPVVVVLGAMASVVTRTAVLEDVTVVVAADWNDGMAASIRAGFTAIEGSHAAAVVVALVDQPWIGAEAVRRLVAAWRGGAVVAVATYAGAPRNPVLFDRSVWPDVAAALRGDAGAREWLRANHDQVTAVACDGTGSARDVDVPGDLNG